MIGYPIEDLFDFIRTIIFIVIELLHDHLNLIEVL